MSSLFSRVVADAPRPASESATVTPLRLAIRDLTVAIPDSAGPLHIDVDLTVRAHGWSGGMTPMAAAALRRAVRSLVARAAGERLEAMAERIAGRCLAEGYVASVSVRIGRGDMPDRAFVMRNAV